MPTAPSFAPRGQQTRQGRPQRVPMFRNDKWPPRPPAQMPVPSFLGSPDSETLLAALPTPSFVTPPEEPAEEKGGVPSKTVIAASAVPLADWFADVVWALYLGPQSVASGGNSGLAGADKAPQPLAAFVHAVLSQTLASPQCAALGLYYLVRLPVRIGSVGALRTTPIWSVALDDDGRTSYASVNDRERAARAAFVAELYAPGAEDVPYRLAALALMLGNKWLDDHTFTNKTWHEVTHLSLARLTALEQRALECFNYSLSVPNDEWRAWLAVLKEGAQGALAVLSAQSAHTAPLGHSLGTTSGSVASLAIDVMERLERELQELVGGVGAGVVDVPKNGVIGDGRPVPKPPVSAQPAVSVPQIAVSTSLPAVSVPVQSAAPAPVQPSVPAQQTLATTEMELDELEMEQVEIDIDLDDGGPVPEELRRPVKVRLGAGGRVEEQGIDKWGGKTEKRSWRCEETSWGESAWGKDKTWGTEKTARVQDKSLPKSKASWASSWDEMDYDAGDEWERALRAAGGGDGLRDRWAAGRDEWDRAVQRPSAKKEASVPRVELYDSGVPVGYGQAYEYRFGYGYGDKYGCDRVYNYDKTYGYGGYDYAKGYDGIGKGAYEYPAKGVYYAPYEVVPHDMAYNYDCYGQYVPRQMPWGRAGIC